MTRDDDRRAAASWLVSPGALGPLASAEAAVAAHPRDPLAAASTLRAGRPDLGPHRTAAVLEQADLRRLSEQRYGVGAGLLLTRDGLEQATRPEVAARRARLLAASGANRVLDITGGLGFDAGAFLAAGLAVTVVEKDPATAIFLAHNCPTASVVTADITEAGTLERLLAHLAPDDVVFADPARRDPAGARDAASGRARPERDPERWSPPWSFVAGIAHGRILAKVAPAFTPPGSWHAEWVSVDRTIVECALASWPLWSAPRQAAVLAHGSPLVLPAKESSCPAAPALGTWLHEPDPAVVRARATGSLALEDPGLRSLDPGSTWLTSERPWSTAAARSYLVVEELTGSARQQRRRLADLGVRRATLKSRDVDVQPRQVLRDLGLAEGPDWVVVMTRRSGRVISVLTQPAAARSG